MKRFLLGLLFAFGLCGCVQAANPSFSSFATNHFITNNFIIRARLNPLQFDTNSWTITITNVAGASTNSLWFNDLGNYVPTTLQNQLTATNIIGNERLQSAGSFILKALMGYTLGAGLNDVSALTNSVLWITGFDSDPANSSLRLDSGNGQGQLMVIQNFADNSGFTMRNGEALFNSAPNSYQILNGDWVSSHKGDCLLLYNNGQSWAEIGRMSGTTNNTGSSLWESVAGVLRPLGHSIGTNQFTIAESTGWTGTGTNAFFDDGTFSGVAMINQTDGAIAKRANAYELEDLAAGTGFLKNDGANNFTWETAGTTINPTDGYMPYRSNATTFEDSPIYRYGTNMVVIGGMDIPNYSSKPLLGIRSTPDRNNAFTIDAVHGGGSGEAVFNMYAIVTNGASGPMVYWQQASAGSTGTTAVGLKIDAYAQTAGTISAPGYDNFDSGTIGILANAAPSGTNSVTAGMLAQSNPGRGRWNVGLGAFVNPSTANPTSTNAGVYSKVLGIGALQYGTAGLFELQKSTDATNTVLDVSAAIVADVRDTGFPFLYARNGGALVFGPGTTNVLYRSGTDLIYTNRNASGTFIQISSDGTRFARYGVNGTVASISGPASGAVYIKANPSASDIVVTSSSIEPSAEVLSLGSSASNGAWTNAYFKGTVHVQGMNDGAGNYSRISLSHSGTNGAAIYNSQAAGTAGAPRNQAFQLGGTNQFSIGDGWVQLMRGMTKAEKATITPTNGMVVYQTDNTPGFRGYVNGSWVIFSTAADP